MHFFASLRALSVSPFQILFILCIHVPFPEVVHFEPLFGGTL